MKAKSARGMVFALRQAAALALIMAARNRQPCGAEEMRRGILRR